MCQPYRSALLLAGLLLFAGVAFAQPTSSPLTDSVQRLPAVRVQGVRPSRFAVGSRVTAVLDSGAVLPTGSTLAEALASRTPLYLKEYGPGQLASISIRGTSAQHTAVLWNGFNVMLPTLGQTDFSLLPLSANTRAEVQHGPAGATYGTGAVGGTVLLSSGVVWGAGLRGTVQTDAGSYGLRAGSAEGSFSNQRIAVRTAASYRTADNDFPYSTREITGLVRRRQENAALRQWSLAQDIVLRVGQRSEVQASAWLTDADRQIQPSIGSANTHAQQWDQSRRLLAGYRHVASRHETGVKVAWFEDVLNFRNDATSSNSTVHTTQAQADHTVNFGTRASLRAGVEAQHFAVEPQLYRREVTENRFAGYALFRYDPRPGLRISANLRQAVLPGRTVPLTPTLGTEWQVWQTTRQQLTLKASTSRSYRAPTLNERFWPQGGDPNLLPESGYGYEMGLQHSYTTTPQLTLTSELTAYRQLVDNWVEWASDPRTGYTTPRNLRQVRAQGLEASSQAKWRLGRYRLSARASYALTQSEKTKGDAADQLAPGKQLAYVPLHSAALTTDQNWRNWQLSSTLRYTGSRSIYSGNGQQLPAYLLLNATMGYTLKLSSSLGLLIAVQGFNLTNRNYQVYEARAMPPRWGSLSLRLMWR
ncbi:TonB-dependent receptor plug domain-containing protein [Microvirga sp. STR05]|uniref:TonB-dependent receptor plug domain-containing protein n=1 Tax=Hymenobacter duratus TaxID=2771356 RepID=A0ABR8JFP1_9BACT|nr:TonB-dependent receptor [Hymenobacter duratus]MBD2714391.1 TonB-dependent receptor plug domain-containing protein [Hymenobacter duratus]MBR7949294.1 TonB-dependent receptor plug domain-containing protein [Microvirga sp. STR05]